jgi:hypothetical protein
MNGVERVMHGVKHVTRGVTRAMGRVERVMRRVERVMRRVKRGTRGVKRVMRGVKRVMRGVDSEVGLIGRRGERIVLSPRVIVLVRGSEPTYCTSSGDCSGGVVASVRELTVLASGRIVHGSCCQALAIGAHRNPGATY